MRFFPKTIFPGLLTVVLAVQPGWAGAGQSEAAQASGAAKSDAPAAAQDSQTPDKWQPADARMLLYKIYGDAYKLGNAVSALHPENWKFGGKKRAAFYQSAASMRAAVTDFRKPWNGFYANPGDSAQGRATLKALQTLQASVKEFTTALADTPGADEGATYEGYAADLTALGQRLDAYVATLEGKATPAGASAPTAGAAPAPTPAAAAPVSSAPETAAPSEPAPASATAATSAPGAAAAPTPTAMKPDEARALLTEVHNAAFRIGDLVSALPVANWKVSDDQRAAFTQKSASLSAAVKSAEDDSNSFSGQPAVPEIGRGTVSAVKALLSETDAFSSALAGSPGETFLGDFKQAAADLAGLEGKLESYLAYLAANEEALASGGAGGAALKTETINSAPAAAPLTGEATERAPLDSQQLKDLLYRAYVPAFRLRDMLGQEQPGNWKAGDADQTAYRESSQMLSQDLADLKKWRDQLEAQPFSLEAAFEVYATLGKLSAPADSVGRIVARYDDPKLGAEYTQRAREVADLRNQLEPYLGYLLRFHDEQVGTVQRNFTACEQELGFAMRPSTQPAVPMKNIIPDFKGRRRDRPASRSEKARAHSERKAGKKTPAKKASKAAAPAPSH